MREEDQIEVDALTGGVSSDIWKIRAGDRIFCLKKALSKMKVGSFSRSERMARWNKGLRIGEQLGQQHEELFTRYRYPWK